MPIVNFIIDKFEKQNVIFYKCVHLKIIYIFKEKLTYQVSYINNLVFNMKCKYYNNNNNNIFDIYTR